MRMIDADALLTEIRKKEAEPNYQHTGEDWCTGLIIAEGLVDEQPTIEPQKWILCSERLPEEHVDVLCCFTSHGKTRIRVSHRMDYNYWNEVGRTGDMVAWMPLPEPWKGERENAKLD